jgi:L-threonylcarbamoyladenylate synthase
MNTIVYRISYKDTERLQEAADVIKRGGIVAFPTETVYGLGASALNEEACTKIFAAKGRPQDNPLIVHVADFDILPYVKYIPKKAQKLMETFWPGPLTIIMPKSELIPDRVTAGLGTVGIRMPENKTARRLIELSGVPIAAPSANLSGKPSPTTIEHCIDDLTGKADMIIGGEHCTVGLESTIVEAGDDKVTILRPGGITYEMLQEAVGTVELDPCVKGKLPDNVKPKAPGMKYRHYAPKAPLAIVKGEAGNVQAYINAMADKLLSEDHKTGVMCTDETLGCYKAYQVISAGSRKQPGKIAANLFDCLREFDKMDIDQIYAEGFNEEGIGLAIMNRLKKAAGYHIINV